MFDPNGKFYNMPSGAPMLSHDLMCVQQEEDVIKYLATDFGPNFKRDIRGFGNSTGALPELAG